MPPTPDHDLAGEFPSPALGAAQLGYEYQDVVGACILAVGLVKGLEALGTEVARGEDTAFDDIEVHRDGRVTRWQLKHAITSASYASLVIGAVVAAFALYAAYDARDAASRLRGARQQLERESFRFAPVRQTAAHRMLVRDGNALSSQPQR